MELVCSELASVRQTDGSESQLEGRITHVNRQEIVGTGEPGVSLGIRPRGSGLHDVDSVSCPRVTGGLPLGAHLCKNQKNKR